MADVVVVVGTKRGREGVPPRELRQMVGRAGRKHGGPNKAIAHVLIEEERIEEVQEGLDEGKHMDIHSTLNSVDGIIFHVMPEISNGSIFDNESAEAWFKKSLASHQGKKIDFEKVFTKMEAVGAIHRDGEKIQPTRVGKIASDLYFHPGDVQAWKDNFTQVFELGLEQDTAAIAWALGTRPNSKSQGDFGDNRYVISECKSDLPMGLDMKVGMVLQVVLWWCCMGGPPAGKMRNQMLELKGDIGRITRALRRLDKELMGWDQEDFFSDVDIMVRRGIKYDLLDLCKLPGITKGRAEYLYSMGASDAEGIVRIMNDIDSDIDEAFTATLEGIKYELSR